MSYDPNQPREPAGSANGGQWTGGDATEAIRQAASNKKNKYKDAISLNDAAELMSSAEDRPTGITKEDAIKNLKSADFNDNSKFILKEIPLSAIQYDYTGAQFQNRELSNKAVKEYVNDIERGNEIKPIILNKKGQVIDGNHRAVASGIANKNLVLAYVPEGIAVNDFDNFSTRLKKQNSTPKQYYADKFYSIK